MKQIVSVVLIFIEKMSDARAGMGSDTILIGHYQCNRAIRKMCFDWFWYVVLFDLKLTNKSVSSHQQKNLR